MWYNALMAALLRSPLHGLLSRDMLLLSYTGRRSGAVYTLPVSYLASGDSLLIMSLRDRVWWRNLRDGALVTLRLRGRDVRGRSEVVEETAEVAAGIAQMIVLRPAIGRYFGLRGRDDPALHERLQRAAESRVIIRVRTAETDA